MILPQFIRFYGYTAEQAFDTLARTFFALVNSMYQLQADERLSRITDSSVAFSGGEQGDKIVSELTKQSKGLHGIVQEVRNIKK